MKPLSLTCAIVLISCVVVGEALKSDCILTWEKYGNHQVKGLQEQSGITTESDCKTACVRSEECWNIDFNFVANTCWFGTVHNPTERIPDTTVNHFDLNCEVKPATTTPPPTPVPTTPPPTPAPTSAPTGADCTEIHRNFPKAKSGVYSITIPGRSTPLSVYCDMDTDCGGWTVFQRRKDGSVNFERNWFDYANGFGDLNGEFWLGNEYLSALTSGRTYRLRVDLENWARVGTYAEYTEFKVAGAADKYRLKFNSCSYFGNAGNALGGALHGASKDHNNMRFSTIDQDNDNYSGFCAKLWHGGWWYNSCHSVNINGLYNSTVSSAGLNWDDYEYSYKATEMKMRSV